MQYSVDSDSTTKSVYIAIQPLGVAKLPFPTHEGINYKKPDWYDNESIPRIKNIISTYASGLSKSTADKLLGAIGYTGNPSVTHLDAIWGDLGGFDHLKQSSTYLLSNGQGFRINTHAVLFDLSLLTPVGNNDYQTHDSWTGFSNTSDNNPFAGASPENPPYLSLSAENFPFDIPASSVPDPGAILSASIYGPEKKDGAWNDGRPTPWRARSLHDSYGSMADKLAAELYLRLLMDEDDPSFGQFSLQEIISQAKESTGGFMGEILAMPYHFSPYTFVWTEVEPLAAPLTAPDVPQTGDSASLAPWLLLLSGAFALLALRRRIQQA